MTITTRKKYKFTRNLTVAFILSHVAVEHEGECICELKKKKKKKKVGSKPSNVR